MGKSYSKAYRGKRMMRAAAALLLAACLLLVVSSPAMPAGGGTQEARLLLEKARRAASLDRHAEAIELYLSACDLDSTLSSELGKELGFQFMWNDRPKEALSWFERHIVRYPEDLEALLGYARALSWSDRHTESLDWYRRIGESHPGSTEARIGEARVVSWMERSGEAERLYLRILESEPENLEARLGLAQVVNWQGRHREARDLFRAILDDHPDEPEALTGLAQAERWLGMNGRALEILGGLEYDEARELRGEIERETAPFIGIEYGISSDSDELVIHRFEAGGTYHPAPATSIGIFAGRASMRQDDRPHIRFESLSLRLQNRFDEGFAANLELKPVRTTFFDPFTFDAWMTWTPIWRLRMDLSFHRVLIETPLSVMREITAKGGNVGADFRFSEHVKMTAQFDRRRYADGNHRTLWTAKLSWRALRSPFELTFVPGYTGFSFSGWEDNGYYSPEEYHNLGCLARVEAKPVRALSVVLEGRVSGEKEGSGDFFSVGMFRAEVAVRATERLDFGSEFYTSNSRLAGEAGYNRTLGRVFLGLRL
jgi:tetratricopeptide (TPR) repeat protein